MRKRMIQTLRVAMSLAVFTALAPSLSAQKVEVHPYAGGIPAISSADLSSGSFDL